MKNPLSILKIEHFWRNLGMLVIMGLAVHLLLPRVASLEHSWHVLSTMNAWLVMLAFLAQTCFYISSGYLLKSIFALTGEPISLRRSTLMYMGITSIGLVAGGMVGSAAAAYSWSNYGDNRHVRATLAGVVPPMLNNMLLVLLSIFGLVHQLLIGELSQAMVIGFITLLSILGLLVGVFAWALRYRPQAIRAVQWFTRHTSRLRKKTHDPAAAQQAVENLFEAWDSLKDGHWHKLLLGAVGTVAFDMLTLFLLFCAAGDFISVGALFTGYGLPLLLGKVAFIVPGGVGVIEGTMTALYTGLGVPEATTGVVVLSYRLISFWLPILLGFPAAAYIRRTLRTENP